jgi:hypothetical protein
MRGLQPFFERNTAEWAVRWDERSDRPHLIQGVGIPVMPGSGNTLTTTDVRRTRGGEPEMADIERLLRDFMNRNPELLRVPAGNLRLDPSRTVSLSGGRTLFVEFQQVHDAIPVEGANVFFRINSGNIVQLGADKVADVQLDTSQRIDRATAFAKVLDAIGVQPAEISEKVDEGTLKIHPALPPGEQPGVAFTGPRGTGYRHLLVWEFVFRRKEDATTYKALVDARSGALLQLLDLNRYTDATVRGGIYPRSNADPEQVRALPFVTVSNGGNKHTTRDGVYDFAGGTASVALDGQFFRMNDHCGSISLSNSVNGNLDLGSGTGTDCATPGVGGAGNTHASRTGFFHLTHINRKAAGFLPGNAWLDSKVTANMNIDETCNAFWNGSTLNFYRSGDGCSNTGELAAIFLHEWGHGLDDNTGGSAGDQGSGEAVGDTFAFLETRDACIGPNFRPGFDCHNCVGCTGVRDLADFAQGGTARIARPDTVTANDGLDCDRFSCPYLHMGIWPYQGPMGYEGHCESIIAGSANWDLAQSLVAAHGADQGWAEMDALWYRSLTPSKSAYQLVSGGKCNAAATVNGCGASNWYTVYLAVDDDDGNLANGTPNGCRIFDAFDAHGIACGTRPACSGGCTPAAQADAGPDRTISAGGSTNIGTPARAGHTYSWSPGGATTAEVTVSPATTTTFTVTATTACGSASDSVTVSVGASGGELIGNGTFEGSVSPWVRSGAGAFHTASAGFPHGGTGYAYLGVDDNVTGTIRQAVTIPATAATANLTFWLNISSSETTSTRKYDQLFVEVLDGAGTVLSTVASYSNLDKTTPGSYAQRGPFDLSAHREQTVRIQFRVTTDVAKRTTFRVDDVSLK